MCQNILKPHRNCVLTVCKLWVKQKVDSYPIVFILHLFVDIILYKDKKIIALNFSSHTFYWLHSWQYAWVPVHCRLPRYHCVQPRNGTFHSHSNNSFKIINLPHLVTTQSLQQYKKQSSHIMHTSTHITCESITLCISTHWHIDMVICVYTPPSRHKYCKAKKLLECKMTNIVKK